METTIVIGFYIVTLLYSIILHEISHGVVALWLGDRTAKDAGRLTLDPVPHIDLFGSIILPLGMILMTGFAFGWAKPVPYNPANLRVKKWGDVYVAFAGPITNFLLALLASIIAAFVPVAHSLKQEIITTLWTFNWTELAGVVAGDISAILFVILAMIIFWNVLLGVFNLIPIPPLDGSKLLFAFVHVSVKTRIFLEQWGILLVLLFIMLPVINAPFHAVLQAFWGIFYTIALL